MEEDPVEKKQILLQMRSIARRPALRYSDAEQAVFGAVGAASPTGDLATVDLVDGPEVDASDGPEVAVPPVKATATKNLIELFDSDSSEEPFEDGDAAEASDAADPIQDVLGAVYEASGYVVLDHVVSEPEDKEWFQDCIQDLFTLFKTNNCVRIWNNGGRGSKAKDDKKRHMLMFSKFK